MAKKIKIEAVEVVAPVMEAPVMEAPVMEAPVKKEVKTSFKLKNGNTFTFSKEVHGDMYIENAKEFAVTNRNIIIG